MAAFFMSQKSGEKVCTAKDSEDLTYKKATTKV